MILVEIENYFRTPCFLTVFFWFPCPSASATIVTIARWIFSFKFTLFTLFFTLCLTPLILLFTTHGANLVPAHRMLAAGALCSSCWGRGCRFQQLRFFRSLAWTDVKMLSRTASSHIHTRICFQPFKWHILNAPPHLANPVHHMNIVYICIYTYINTYI